MMHVRSKTVYSAVQLDGLKTSYPSWIKVLILKNKLRYHPDERKWTLYDKLFYDGDILVYDKGVIGMSLEEFDKKYEECR